MTKKPNTRWIIALALLVLLSIGLIVVKAPVEYWQQASSLGARLQSSGPVGLILAWTLASLAISVGLPRQLFAFVFGFAYGAALGAVLAISTAVAGCVITYTMVRYVFARRFQNRYPAIRATLESWVADDLFLKVIILRFQPLGTNLLSNVCAGLVPLPARTFFISSAIGFVPQSLVFCLLGAGVRVGSATQMWLSLALFALSLLLALVVYKRAR